MRDGNLANKEEATKKLQNFQIYWECQTSIRLQNSKMIKEHPAGPKSSNIILNEFARSYYISSINSALLELFEVVELIDVLTPGFRKKIYQDEKYEESCLQRVMKYRNKFLAHKEFNSFNSQWITISKEISSGKVDIFAEIECAYQRVLKSIRDLGIEPAGGQVEAPRFSHEEISDLINSANYLKK